MPLEEGTQGSTLAIASKMDTFLTTTRSDARLVVAPNTTSIVYVMESQGLLNM